MAYVAIIWKPLLLDSTPSTPAAQSLPLSPILNFPTTYTRRIASCGRLTAPSTARFVCCLGANRTSQGTRVRGGPVGCASLSVSHGLAAALDSTRHTLSLAASWRSQPQSNRTAQKPAVGREHRSALSSHGASSTLRIGYGYVMNCAGRCALCSC
jgi:hypothetical protein